jgi:hypothetical protein
VLQELAPWCCGRLTAQSSSFPSDADVAVSYRGAMHLVMGRCCV